MAHTPQMYCLTYQNFKRHKKLIKHETNRIVKIYDYSNFNAEELINLINIEIIWPMTLNKILNPRKGK